MGADSSLPLCCLGPSLWPVSLLTPSNSSCLSFPDVCSYLPHLSGTCSCPAWCVHLEMPFLDQPEGHNAPFKTYTLPRLCSISVSTLLTISPFKDKKCVFCSFCVPRHPGKPQLRKRSSKRLVIWILNSMVFIIWFFFNWEALFNTVGILPWASAVLLFLQNYLIPYPFCGW